MIPIAAVVQNSQAAKEVVECVVRHLRTPFERFEIIINIRKDYQKSSWPAKMYVMINKTG